MKGNTFSSIVGGLLLDADARVYLGALVTCCNELWNILLGDYIISSIVDPLGCLILKFINVIVKYKWSIEILSPGIVDRTSVFEPLQTGLLALDSMVPVGRGQRELIIGDRQSGKTSIAIDTILNQSYTTTLSIYCPVGQKSSSILETYLSLVQRDSIYSICILIASAGSSSLRQFLSVYSGCCLSEFLLSVRNISGFIVFDDLSKHAIAYREIYLLLKRPPGREAYPGEIFYVHSRLLERSCKLNKTKGGGSLSSFPVVETLEGDISSYITTNIISITDGQIFLSIDLFLSGIKPALDSGLSVSRVGSSAQWAGMKVLSGKYKLQLAQFAELQSFSQFSCDIGAETQQKLDDGMKLLEVGNQVTGSPLSLSTQISILSIMSQRLLVFVKVSDVKKYIKIYILLPELLFVYLPLKFIFASIL